VGYVLTAAFVVLALAIVAGVLHVRHENRRAGDPHGMLIRRAARRVMAGDRCRCGGTIGRAADQSGELLTCTGCSRGWTMDGRRIVPP
jgi:hypothetical protein